MALISNTDITILPYNDNDMVYDLDRRFYVLTNNGVKNLLGVNLEELSGDSTKATLVRYRVSQDIITMIRRYSRNDYFKYKLYQIAKDETTREMIKQILVEQLSYYIESGAGLLKNQHGVSIEKSKALDLASIRGNVLLSAGAEQMLLSSGLLNTGYLYVFNYDEDGTW